MKIKRDKESSKKDREKKSVAAGLGSIVGGLGGAIYLGKNSKKNSSRIRSEFKEENSRLFRDLVKKEAEPQGTNIYVRTSKKDKNYNNGLHSSRVTKERARRGIKLGKGGDYIISSHHASTLAHELGHSKYEKKGRVKGGLIENLGKFTHKTDGIGRGFLGVPGLKKSFMVGAGIGMINKSDSTKKKDKLIRHAAWGLPLAVTALPITSEVLATRKGLKLLRKHGASRKFMKECRRDLNKSLGTYAGGAIASAGAGELGRVVGERMKED